MARQFIYHMQGLTKAFSGGKKVLENIHLSFYPDAKIGVLGPNGSGKSTLLKIMAGLDKEFTGEAWAARGRARRLPAAGAAARPVARREGQRHARRRGEAGDPRPLQRADDELLRRDGGGSLEAAGRDRRARTSGTSNPRSRCRWRRSAARPATPTSTTLSGGEKRRVALCKLLLEEPDLLLLDEPTNHLDAETVAWLEKHLELFPGAVLIVTHDRYFLDNVTGWILELDRGRGVPYEGNYTAYLDKKAKRMRAGEARGRARARRSSSASANGWAARPRRAAPSRRRASRPMTSS